MAWLHVTVSDLVQFAYGSRCTGCIQLPVDQMVAMIQVAMNEGCFGKLLREFHGTGLHSMVTNGTAVSVELSIPLVVFSHRGSQHCPVCPSDGLVKL